MKEAMQELFSVNFFNLTTINIWSIRKFILLVTVGHKTKQNKKPSSS